MKYLKLFENFNKSDLENKLDEYGIKNYTINDDGTVDVNVGVTLCNRKLEKIPFKFGIVNGNFDCSFNDLVSLEGSPREVTGSFWCDYNNLKDLNGSPKEVGEYFNCSHNELESLEGMPLEIGRGFGCVGNSNLKTLDSVSNIEGYIECGSNIDISKFRGYCKGIRKSINGKWVDVKLNESNLYEEGSLIRNKIEHELSEFGIRGYTINEDGTIDVDDNVGLSERYLTKIPFKFGKVSGDFDCYDNKLTSLEGSPKEVGGNFICSNNNLANLKGSPRDVGGDFDCCSNKSLTNLVGSPEEVGGDFYCSFNKLTSLEGMPFEIGKDFVCYDNPYLKKLYSISNIEGDIYCDENIDTSKFDGYCKNIIKK